MESSFSIRGKAEKTAAFSEVKLLPNAPKFEQRGKKMNHFRALSVWVDYTDMYVMKLHSKDMYITGWDFPG